MDLKYKKDWETCKERYMHWWAHEYFGRCGIWITAPKEKAKYIQPPKPPPSIPDRWLDEDYIISLNNYIHSNTFYGGEAIPVWSSGYPGWDMHPVFLGCPVSLDEVTGWINPIIDKGSLSDYDPFKLIINRDGKWFRKSKHIRQLSIEHCMNGNALPTTGAYGGCGDTLASLRSTSNLLIDLIECPEKVCEFELYLMKQWTEIYEERHRDLRKIAEGSIGWFDLWAPGKFYAAQCDFAYMISPKMFESVFLPAIKVQTEFLDYSIYHVDGIGNFNHIDMLLELPKLQGLQILPGDGKPSPLYYMDILKKVQGAGKNLHITIPPEELMTALDELSARGLFIQTWASSEQDAQDIIRNVECWSKDRG